MEEDDGCQDDGGDLNPVLNLQDVPLQGDGHLHQLADSLIKQLSNNGRSNNRRLDSFIMKYVWLFTEFNGRTDGQMDRWTDRQRDKG